MTIRIYRLPQVLEMTGIGSDMQLRRMEARGDFPKRFKISPNSGVYGATGWLASEVEAYIKARANSRETAA